MPPAPRPPARRRYRPRLEPLEPRAAPAVNVLGGFAGLDFNASGGVEPPDTDVAVGPTHVVETVNSAVAFYDRTTGAKVFQQDLANFFAPAGAGPLEDMFDAVVTYDDLAGRFVVGTLEQNDAAQTSYFDVAVSNTSDPTQGFTEMHHVAVKEGGSGGLAADFPRLGWNADAYVVTFNMYHFPNPDGAFDHVQVLTFAKSSLLDANNGTLTTFRADRTGPADQTLTPAVMHTAAPGGPIWLLEENDGSTNLRFVEMTNATSPAPTFTDFVVGVPAYGAVVPPAQPGGPAITDEMDSSILDVAIRGSEVVACQNVGAAGVTRARWYQFDLSGASPSLVQLGEVNRGPGVFSYYPSIDLAPDGAMGMSFIESSSSEFMSMYVTGRTALDGPGTLQTPVLVQAGRATYTGTRAGDFSGVGVDPTDGTFWAANEFANRQTVNWGTWVAHFTFGVPPVLAVGADAGGPPEVHVYNAATGALVRTIEAYAPTFLGGVRVAVGDVTGDGRPDVVTAPGPTGGPDVRVFDAETGQLLHEFMAYDPFFLGGIYVALADLGGAGGDAVVTAPDAGGGPDVRLFSAGGAMLHEFMAYDAHFLGGVRVAAGDVTGDGVADVLTAPGPGGGPDVRAYSGTTLDAGQPVREFYAYDPGFLGGLYVAAGDTNGDGRADIITGAGAGGGPHVKVFSGADGVVQSFFAYAPQFTGGVRVGFVANYDGAGDAGIVTGAGPGGGPHVQVFDGRSLAVVDSFFAYAPDLTTGVFVGGS